ncbi:MAG: serine/threonine protein kinase [Oculatellaceae cyanobacterium Prado106]|nr:serine/threonine protein kinase [Oculatellaceae cyanobacterium Prado106]
MLSLRAGGRQTWLAIDRHTQEPVTVKLMAFNPQLQWDELKLFEREAQVLKTLDHRRVPHYRDDFSMEDEGLWLGLVQDYVVGRSLQDSLDQGEVMTEAELRKLAGDLLGILIYLHSFDPAVLHRDIKPSNLIRGEDGEIYLVDFGAVQDQVTLTGVPFTVVGTCGYAPQEQFWGHALPASDLYALGATLIHLATGVAPMDLPQRDLRIQFADLVDLSPFFTAWLAKLTEPAIERRFSTAHAALTALKEEQIATPSASRMMRKLQPDRSQIRLIKSAFALKIHFPALQGWRSFKRFPKLDGSKLILLAGIALMVVTASGVTGLLLSLMMVASFVYLCIQQLSEQVDLSFEGDRFQIVRRFLGFPTQSLEGNISQILGVFLLSMEQQQHLMIRTQQSVHDVGGCLTELEALWLVQEIQDWLNFANLS